jgi:hypothetical protein
MGNWSHRHRGCIELPARAGIGPDRGALADLLENNHHKGTKDHEGKVKIPSYTVVTLRGKEKQL